MKSHNEKQRRRYPWSKIILVGPLFVAILYILFVNYKYHRLMSTTTSSLHANTAKLPIRTKNEYTDSCFKARTDTVPRSLYGKLSYPFINLGFPKIGSSSLHSFFGCSGYRSSHYRCSPTLRCAECIEQSITAGLPPLTNCILAEVFSQIDDGSNGNFPQIKYLEKLVQGYHNATFILVFRDMNHWYKSLQRWSMNGTRMDQHLMMADIQGFPAGVGRNIHEFSEWFCNHVTRVRNVVNQYPSAALVEIDLEDDTKTRQRMSEIFDVDANCWSRSNANLELHPQLSGTFTAEGQSKWFLTGNKMIKGKDGKRRKRNYPGRPFPLYA